MLKYSVFIDQTSPLFERDRKRILIPELDVNVLAYVDEHPESEDMAKWVLAKSIDWKIMARTVINVDQEKREPIESEIFCEVDWKTELRIRVSNALLYSTFEDIVNRLWNENVRTNVKEIQNLFGVFNKLDIILMLEVIRALRLPFQLQQIKFKYE